MNIKHFAVHQGFLYGMAEDGTTWRQETIGNTGWVRLSDPITGDEPTDSSANDGEVVIPAITRKLTAEEKAKYNEPGVSDDQARAKADSATVEAAQV
jgi:hypothetical protein